jgi:hypothetical protein
MSKDVVYYGPAFLESLKREVENENIAQSYDMGRDLERAAVLALLDRELEIAEVHDLLVGTVRLRELREIIARGDHRDEEHVEVTNEERAAVVAWLREVSERRFMRNEREADIVFRLAHDVERGEHRREEER